MLHDNNRPSLRRALQRLVIWVAMVTPAVADEPPANQQSGLIEVGVVDVAARPSTTLAALESAVLAAHPAVIAARRQVDAARGQYVQAGLKYNPTLLYQADEVGNEQSAGLQVLGMSQRFVTAGKLGLARQVQAQQVQKQIAQLQLTELRVLTQLRIAYARALVAQQRVELTQQMAELAAASVESVQALYDAAEVSKVSLLQARVEAERTSIAADVAATQLDAFRRALAAAAGLDVLAPGPIVGDLDAGLTEAPWEPLLAEITTASPELAAAGSELERARRALRHACASAIPDITAQAGVGVDTNSEDTFVRFSIAVPLPIHNRNQGNIRTARSQIGVAEASIEQTLLDLRQRLADAVARYRTARGRAIRLRDQIIPDAEETFELSRQAFQAGESSYLQLMAAQRTLIETRLQVLQAIGQARQAEAEIDGLLVTLDG